MGRINGMAWNSASIRKVLGRGISNYMTLARFCRATSNFVARRNGAGVTGVSERWRNQRCVALGGCDTAYLEWYRRFDGFVVSVGAITI
jgi:hypothetical protein